MKKIPVTVLTGFLGSGKTTLLNRILSENHGQRIAVIENEFGEIGIDQALVIDADEEVFEMNNGCICCTVRGDLIRILGNLMKRRDKFDRILVETTGMADPSPVAQTFFVDDDMRDMFSLDGIITLVDAKHVMLHIDDSRECQEQIAFADVLVLNKIDLVRPEDLAQVERRIRSMNRMAKVLHSSHAQVPLSSVLDIGGFDLERAVASKPGFLTPEYPFEWAATFELPAGDVILSLDEGPDASMDLVTIALSADEDATSPALCERALRVWSQPALRCRPGSRIALGLPQPVTLDLASAGSMRYPLHSPSGGRFALYTQHLPTEFQLSLQHQQVRLAPRNSQEFAASHTHAQDVTSVGLHSDAPIDGERLNQWLSKLLREQGAAIFRMKGILNIHGKDKRYVFQGVHMLFDGREDRPWGSEARSSDLVFIGRSLDRVALQQGFEKCHA
ncbi:MAG: GTP-binding protein [Myxococcales bacterium]|nr:GTP-binding protein [Myxococcales bacterium]